MVAALPDGVLVAGIDGVGHGAEAASAAHRAAEVIRERPGADLELLIARCHAALRGTRGAAISLAFVCPAEHGMTWLGVGNVEGRVLGSDPAATGPKGSLGLSSGVPGHELPPVKPATLPIEPGDVLLLATDGIDRAFADAPDVSGSPRTISERILARHWKAPDDALVVAVRYLGPRR